MAHGGKRQGAGRPKGQGVYGEPTTTVRVPLSLAKNIKHIAASSGFKIPLYSSPVQAGVLSEAESEVEEHIDLNNYLVKNPQTTFVVRATGDSMIDAGIEDGDMLIVDRGVRPSNGKIVIAAIDNQFTVKFLRMKDNQLWLMPANKTFSPIAVDKHKGVVILGVVMSSIKSH
jgi:DNA polymerase V